MFNLKSSIEGKNSQNHSVVLEGKNLNWWLGKLFIWAWRLMIDCGSPSKKCRFQIVPTKISPWRWKWKDLTSWKLLAVQIWTLFKKFQMIQVLFFYGIVQAVCICWLNALVRKCRHSLMETRGECSRIFSPSKNISKFWRLLLKFDLMQWVFPYSLDKIQ